MANMGENEKLSMVKLLLDIEDGDTSEDNLILAYLTASEKEILAWRYSYGTVPNTGLPEEYEMTQVFAVVAGYSIGGAEGQTQHTENGINRTFQYADMVDYIRAHVVPVCKVV